MPCILGRDRLELTDARVSYRWLAVLIFMGNFCERACACPFVCTQGCVFLRVSCVYVHIHMWVSMWLHVIVLHVCACGVWYVHICVYDHMCLCMYMCVWCVRTSHLDGLNLRKLVINAFSNIPNMSHKHFDCPILNFVSYIFFFSICIVVYGFVWTTLAFHRSTNSTTVHYKNFMVGIAFYLHENS